MSDCTDRVSFYSIGKKKSKIQRPQHLSAHPCTEKHSNTMDSLVLVRCVTLFNIFTAVELVFIYQHLYCFRSHIGSLFILSRWTYYLGLFLDVSSDAPGLGQNLRPTYFPQLLSDITAAGSETVI